MGWGWGYGEWEGAGGTGGGVRHLEEDAALELEREGTLGNERIAEDGAVGIGAAHVERLREVGGGGGIGGDWGVIGG